MDAHCPAVVCGCLGNHRYAQIESFADCAWMWQSNEINEHNVNLLLLISNPRPNKKVVVFSQTISLLLSDFSQSTRVIIQIWSRSEKVIYKLLAFCSFGSTVLELARKSLPRRFPKNVLHFSRVVFYALELHVILQSWTTKISETRRLNFTDVA